MYRRLAVAAVLVTVLAADTAPGPAASGLRSEATREDAAR
jgi:hypothetical protein